MKLVQEPGSHHRLTPIHTSNNLPPQQAPLHRLPSTHHAFPSSQDHHRTPLQVHPYHASQQDQPGLPRAAHLHRDIFKNQEAYEAYRKGLTPSTRDCHDHHTALAIESGDAAHYNGLTVADLQLAKGFGIVHLDSWRNIPKYTGRATRLEREKGIQKSHATNGPERKLLCDKIEDLRKTARESQEEAIATSNKVWEAIHKVHPTLQRQAPPPPY